MKVNLVNIETEKTSSEDLQDEFFGLDPRKDILHRVVTWQLSRKRLGTRKTKSRGEITGSTKKIMRQKGSGGARHRTKKVNLFRLFHKYPQKKIENPINMRFFCKKNTSL